MPVGFGSLMNGCTNFDSANCFIINIFSGFVNFLLDYAYAQADLRLCWPHIPRCLKSHAMAHILTLYFHLYICLK